MGCQQDRSVHAKGSIGARFGGWLLLPAIADRKVRGSWPLWGTGTISAMWVEGMLR